jgi:hypothetical protein
VTTGHLDPATLPPIRRLSEYSPAAVAGAIPLSRVTGGLR